MAKYMEEIFGDLLLKDFLKEYPMKKGNKLNYLIVNKIFLLFQITKLYNNLKFFLIYIYI